MARPLTQAARDRLRAQIHCEQEHAVRVLAAEARLAAEVDKRDAAIAAHDAAIMRRRDAVAEALIEYIDQAGVGIERAAIILGRRKGELARLVRERRHARQAQQREDTDEART